MLAYVDTSILAAVACKEDGWEQSVTRLKVCDRWFAAPLLEAEFSALVARENLPPTVYQLLDPFTWIPIRRRLTEEIQTVLQFGYLRGADLWHLAAALSWVKQPSELSFLTLDVRQKEVASLLGFPV